MSPSAPPARRGLGKLILLLTGMAWTAGVDASSAQPSTDLRATLTICGPAGSPCPQAEPQQLQLEVFINGVSSQLVAAFTLRPDGELTTTPSELDDIGLKPQPGAVDAAGQVALNRLEGISYVYKPEAQAVYITAATATRKPLRIEAGRVDPRGEPMRPPLGAVLNYTLFADGNEGPEGAHFEGLSGAFETRLFGRYGVLESTSVVNYTPGGRTRATRLDTFWAYEDVDRLLSYRAGDMISGGLDWTRPIRMAGVKVRRNFSLRPDIVTIPTPTLRGTAAAASTLDLYINSVRTLTSQIPAGPFEVDHPPVAYGEGVAELVLQDVLGRRVVLDQAFYSSPELLAPGLTDFSLEAGFPRRNFATRSNDYDLRPAASGSVRFGWKPWLTLEGHAEASTGMVNAGAGGVFTVGRLGLGKVAVGASHSKDGFGALLNVGLQIRRSWVTLSLQSHHTFGDYEDLASWTAEIPVGLPINRGVFLQARDQQQASASFRLPWRGASFGVSYVRSIREEDRSQIANISYTQDVGRASLFVTAINDFDRTDARAIFVGLSMPLGAGIHSAVGVTETRGSASGYAEVAKQDSHHPGSFGWAVRLGRGEGEDAQAALRYTASFARFEATATYAGGGQVSGTLQAEGALSLIGGSLKASTPLQGAFALVDVGVPGVPILRENRPVGRTGRDGRLIVPDLTPFVDNRLALDPADLPVDAQVSVTETVATPYARSPVHVRMKVSTEASAALVVLTAPDGKPVELGAAAVLQGTGESFTVGYDGHAYLTGLKGMNVVDVTTPQGGACRASFPFRARSGEQVRIETVCRPS